ncbi:MAG: CBS domain-containing protein [Desulfatiglans sp.]|jgi:CBS domain-containing protein|nr:CBS domain-containing protein [Thermodesulfobacteriota bacterium]MEE4354060.1 CBS domain-containing protein [Desulfatiglans sp.]
MYEFIHYQAGDVMTLNPVTVRKEMTLAAVEDLFEQHDFNGIPVVDEENKMIGIMTKLNLLKAFAFTERDKVPDYKSIMNQNISSFMSRDVILFSPQTPVSRVLQKMIETKHKSFPVVKGDHLIGIIAREDVLKAVRMAASGKVPDRMT